MIETTRTFGCLVLVFVCLSAASVSLGADGELARIGPVIEKIAKRFDAAGEADALEMAGRYMVPTRSDQSVVVILEPRAHRGASSIGLAQLRRLGATLEARSRNYMRVRVPPRLLRRLARHSDVRVIRAPTPAVEHAFGSIASESALITGAEALQVAGITGAGVKVAVVDLGFAGLNEAQQAGEVTSNSFDRDLTNTGSTTGTAHGTGVAEHVCDMAPGIELHMIKVGDEVDLENAADYIRDNGIKIANHSVGWVISSYYDDTGNINDIINRSHDVDGVFWTVSSGNSARRHWRSGWVDDDGDGVFNFTASFETMWLTTVSSTSCVFLNWNQYGNSATDLDLFILDNNDTVVAQGIATQNGLQQPSEAICFGYDTNRDPYQIAIDHFSGPTQNLDMTIFSFNNNLEFPRQDSSMMDPANAHGAFTVGAVFHPNWGQAVPPLESYSSRGPTNDGRLKPDVVAPDGTSSMTYGLSGSFGTSFSSPTVAGAAALLLQQDPTLTPQELAVAIRAQAIEVGGDGPDNDYGYGKLSVGAIDPNSDSDSDFIPDALDNCPHSFNPFQENQGGVGPLALDNVGDICQCGDVTGDGQVLADDRDMIQAFLAGQSVIFNEPDRCNVVGPAGENDCDLDDWVLIARAVSGEGPGLQLVCEPALP